MINHPTISHTEMRQINRSAILDSIRRRSPVSRAYLAKSLNVSLPTVLRIVDELIDCGLIREQDAKEWSGGRKRSLLELNTDDNLVIGVDLGGTKMFGAVADIGGNILDEIDINPHNLKGEDGYKRLVELIETLLNSHVLQGRKVRGIGIGAPGVTMHDKGVVTWAPSLEWRDLPLKDLLSDHFDLTTMVDNDVNLAALGELWFGAGREFNNIVLLAVGTGIGAGIIIDRTVFRGMHQASGEVGYLPPGREYLNHTYDSFGPLESLASGIGIVKRARDKYSQEIGPIDTAKDIFSAARAGKPWACDLVAETVDYLAMGVISLDLVLDPEVIILSGGVFKSEDLLVEPIIQKIKPLLPSMPKVVISALGRRAAALGAVAMIFNNTDEYYILRRIT